MKTWSKKGYALALAMITVIILTIIGLGLYSSVSHVVREIKVQETGHIRGHYAALSALRYATILLRSPEVLFGKDPVVAGDKITISLWSNYNAAALDMGLSANHDIDLKITKKSDGEFDVEATYYYDIYDY